MNAIVDSQAESEEALSAAQNVQAQLVSMPSRVTKFVEHLANHPLDFALSTAGSVGAFMFAKTLTIALLGSLATPIVAGIIAAGAVGMLRAGFQAYQNRDERLEKLQQSGNPPSAEDLQQANQINIKAIFNAGIRHAMISGIVGSLVGMILSPEIFPEDSEIFNGDLTSHGTHAHEVATHETELGALKLEIPHSERVLLSRTAAEQVFEQQR